MPQEPRILAALALMMMISGVVLAALSRRVRFKSLVPRGLAGSMFLLGFLILGVAIGH